MKLDNCKIGDNLVCIKFFDWGDDRVYYPGHYYKILNIFKHEFFIKSEDVSAEYCFTTGRWFNDIPKPEKNKWTRGNICEYFCDIKEYRKLKLEKINCKNGY